MKEFRYPAGHSAGKTATVKEMREFLTRFPDDMPVMATWEGVWAYVDPENAEVEKVTKGNDADACKCLVFDVGGVLRANT